MTRATGGITKKGHETLEIIKNEKRDCRDYQKIRETGGITKKNCETVEITKAQCHST